MPPNLNHDDLSANVPEAEAIGALMFSCSLDRLHGHIYQVQYTTNMNSDNWNIFTNITPSNWTGVMSVPIGPEPQRY